MADRSKTPDLFTPLFECVVEKYGIIGAGVFGEVWRYCQMDRHQCDAAAETIGKTLHVSLRTVQRWLKVLAGNDAEWNAAYPDHKPYIRDLTPGRRNKPHVYVSTSTVWRDAENKHAMPESHTATPEPAPTMPESHTAMQESHSAMTESPHNYDRESYEETYKRLPEETSKETAQDAPPAPETRTITPGPEPQKPAPTLTPQEVDAYLATPDPVLLEKWPEILAEVQGQVTRGSFEQIYGALKPLTIRDGTAILWHPTGPGADTCRVKLKIIMPRTVGSILHAPLRVSYAVGGTP